LIGETEIEIRHRLRTVAHIATGVKLATATAGVRQVNHADAAVSLGDIIHPTFAPLPDQENDMEEIHDSRLQLYATALAGSIDFSIVSHLPIRGPIRIHYTIHKP
jgi:hypothetical protein